MSTRKKLVLLKIDPPTPQNRPEIALHAIDFESIAMFR